MTKENQITECSLCPGRLCIVSDFGRIINDNNGQPINKEKIKVSATPIENCDLRESLASDDERNLVGS